jgi:hypothetical protein
MPSNDLIPNYAPPPGGLSKLMKRIDERETRSQWFKQKKPLYKGLFVASFAAACAFILLPQSSLTISDLIRDSDALHLFKYGLKPMPAEGIRVSSHLGAVMLKETGYGFRAEIEGP